MNLPKNILVPTDFSEYGEAAVEYAAQFARQLGATLHLLHVITVPSYGVPELGVARTATLIQTAVGDAQAKLDAIATELRDRVTVAPTRLEVGDARDLIDQVAAQVGADLIIMGTHGRRGFSRLLMGSVAETVVRTAPCPVLTVHRAA